MRLIQKMSSFYMWGSWNQKKRRARPTLQSKYMVKVNGDFGCVVCPHHTPVLCLLLLTLLFPSPLSWWETGRCWITGELVGNPARELFGWTRHEVRRDHEIKTLHFSSGPLWALFLSLPWLSFFCPHWHLSVFGHGFHSHFPCSPGGWLPFSTRAFIINSELTFPARLISLEPGLFNKDLTSQISPFLASCDAFSAHHVSVRREVNTVNHSIILGTLFPWLLWYNTPAFPSTFWEALSLFLCLSSHEKWSNGSAPCFLSSLYT